MLHLYDFTASAVQRFHAASDIIVFCIETQRTDERYRDVAYCVKTVCDVIAIDAVI